MVEGGDPLKSYGAEVLMTDLRPLLRCPESTIYSFIERTAAAYKDNPYHNAAHATQVCHNALWFARKFGLAGEWTGKERASFIIAAVCHDVGHFGRNAAFCMQTEHELSLLYNDRCILENMHAATAFRILATSAADGSRSTRLEEEVAMLGLCSGDERATMREHIIELILSTDMSEHFQFISKMRVRRDAPDWNLKLDKDRLSFGKTCMKAADISHSAMPWHLHTQWSMRVIEEFFEQGDQESQLGLPVSPLCDRTTSAENLRKSQKGFIQIVCSPLFELVARCGDALNMDEVCIDEPGHEEVTHMSTQAFETVSGHVKANAEKWLEDQSVDTELKILLQPRDSE